ncbi:MAG: hypothetical protein ACREDR_09125, partial [Blastocatellia bacterium]
KALSADIIKLLIKSFFILALVSTVLAFFALILGMLLNRRPDPLHEPQCVGRSVVSSGAGPVAIESRYDPSGVMGDVGDISIERDVGAIRFKYETQGRGPHEWDWKYRDSMVNPEPAQFAGVMYLDPPNNWGDQPGLDLRGYKTVKWDARSLDGEVKTEFVIGGVVWKWNNEEKIKTAVFCPDSMPRISLGLKNLGDVWQSFEYEISDQPDDDFTSVIGGFGWVITWSSNGVQLNEARSGPVQPRTFKIEIRNIRYERRQR